jgi:ABC-type branched-subunit amino acid transport system ATPase component
MARRTSLTNISISKVEIHNYRSCLKTSFAPERSLSALIGVNASGKSNILNSILLLRKMTRQSRFRGQDSFLASTCKLKVNFKIGDKDLPYQALIKFSTDDHNRDEVDYAREKWNFREFTKRDVWYEVPMVFGSRGDEHPFASAQLSVRDINRRIYNLAPGMPFRFDKIYPPLSSVFHFVSGITYYSASQFTDPSRCPPSLEIDDEGSVRRLSRQYEHVQFIYDLYQAKQKSKDEYETFLALVGAGGVKLIDDIKFTEITVPSSVFEVKAGGKIVKRRRKTLLVIPNIFVQKSKLSPNQLSEGTFKTLALVFYLITDKSKLLLLEEPEVCVHHGLLASIIELIKSVSKRKQIIISTHSDFVLDMFDASQVYVVQNVPRQGTVVKHIPSSLSRSNYKALKDYLDTTGSLGDYWRHGELDL